MWRAIAAVSAGLMFLPSSALGTESSVPFIKADQVHALGITGSGVTVAVIDTGIYYDHHGLLGSIADGGVSFENDIQYNDGGADIYGNGHGTYMSLIITDQSGVAPDAMILPIRVLGEDGSIQTRDIRRAIEYTTARRELVDTSIRVINLSLGGGRYACRCDGEIPDLAVALANAAAAGIVSFAATGNEACCGSIASPACVYPAMPVAAAYDADYYGTAYYDLDPDRACIFECEDFRPREYYVTCFSNWVEECSALSAPGFDITVGGFGYDGGHGTSQATAHCSGAAALMFERGGCPLSAWQARSIIYNTAYDIWFAFPYCRRPPPPRHLDALAAVLAVPPWCAGDIDGDRDIDLADLSILIAHYGSSVDRCTNGDLDGDGDVDLADLSVLIARYRTNCD